MGADDVPFKLNLRRYPQEVVAQSSEPGALVKRVRLLLAKMD